MKRLTTILLGLTVLFGVSLYSCKSDSNKDNVKDIEIADEVNQMVYPIPTPFEVSQMLEKSGASFILDLTNSTENVNNYFTEKSKALNLGVYGADLSYTSSYNQSQGTRKLLTVTKQLTEDLEITSAFSESLLERVEQNIENKDSLYKIVSSSYYDTFNQLNNSQKGSIAVMVLAGGWVESLYLICELASVSKDKTELLKGLAQQRLTSSTIIPLLNNYKDNADVVEITSDIQKIKTVFDKLQQVDDEFVIDEAQMKELHTIVTEIRTKIIKLS